MPSVDERVSLLLRLRRSTVERLDALAEELDTSRSQAVREVLASGFAARDSKPISRSSTAAVSPLDAQDRKLLGWLNDFAERCYLGGAQVKVGADLAGLRFNLEPRVDPDRDIP